MKLNKSDILQAQRISKAIDDMLFQEGSTVLGAREVSIMLQRKGILKTKSSNTALEFSRFLKLLLESDALNLIPQCQAIKRNENHIDWYFHPTDKRKERNLKPVQKMNIPEYWKKAIKTLPATQMGILSSAQIKLLKSHPRIFDLWSQKEQELLKKAYGEFQDSLKLSQIFQRPLAAIEKKLRELNIT